ncbi:GAF domain-containing protein [Hyphobacterium sp.]|jgi:PAS domain S-box-containing protein|uniref:PAS domain-containing sensor histidine kinase n=1 Tax=Hyphobacterium sp. TaxID=2004662 RepID=UPI003BACC1EC
MAIETKAEASLDDELAAFAVERREAAYDSLFLHSLDSVKLVDKDGALRRINQCGCDSLEVKAPEQVLGQSYFGLWSGKDSQKARAAAAEADRSGSGRFTGLYTSPSGHASYWDEVLTATYNEDGQQTGYLIISRDVTENHQLLCQQRALAQIGTAALSTADFGVFLQHLTETLAETLGLPMTKVLEITEDRSLLLLRAGVGWQDGLVGEAIVGTERDSQAGYTLMSDGPVIVDDLTTESRFSGPQLLRQHKVRSGMSVIIAGENSAPYGVLGVHTNALRQFNEYDIDFIQAVANTISARWRQECASREQKTLVREMAHRAGNMFQIAGSLFRQSFNVNDDVETAKRDFSDRLDAMARSCASIARGGFETTSIRALANDTLCAFGGPISVTGRDFEVPGDLAFDLGLMWHELATNSAKYGALNSLRGEVQLSWKLSRDDKGRCLSIVWLDTSPAGDKSANGSGFGTQLISQLVELKYSGRIEIRERPEYRCEMLIRLP